MFHSLVEIEKVYVRWQILAVCAVFLPVVIWLGGLSLFFYLTNSSYTDVESNWQKIGLLLPLALLIYIFKLIAGAVLKTDITCKQCKKRIFTGQRPEVAVKTGVCPYCNLNLINLSGEEYE